MYKKLTITEDFYFLYDSILWDEIMRNSLFWAMLLLFGLTGVLSAQEADSLKQALSISSESGKPVLLEFVRTD